MYPRLYANDLRQEEVLSSMESVRTFLDDVRDEGREEGIQQGREEERLRNARNMLQKGIDKKDIIEITGISNEKLLELEASW